jgi:alpha-aminoadipate/glutamate carrier protein LysW
MCLTDIDNRTLLKGTCTTMSAPTCPTCGTTVLVPANVMKHEIIPCQDCGTELEVLSLDPLQLDLAPEVEEDWGE